jgi:predicted  nucleic acid-binding Zn-ribbon protein
MKSINEVLAEIDYKVRQLANERDELKSSLKEANEREKELRNQIMDLVKENKNLKEELELKKITNIINNHSDVSESKVIINNLLKKINDSISIITSKNN